jgi:hypothetical protein
LSDSEARESGTIEISPLPFSFFSHPQIFKAPGHGRFDPQTALCVVSFSLDTQGDGVLDSRRQRHLAGKTRELTGNVMWQQDAYLMIQRRAAIAGIKTRRFPRKQEASVPAPPQSVGCYDRISSNDGRCRCFPGCERNISKSL